MVLRFRLLLPFAFVAGRSPVRGGQALLGGLECCCLGGTRGGLFEHGLVAEVLSGDDVLYRTDTQYRLPESESAASVDLVVTRSR